MKGKVIIAIAISLLWTAEGYAQLKKGEASVDFRFAEGEYTAVVNRADWVEKKTVKLCTAEDLAGMPTNSSLYDRKLATNAYHFIFEPLEQYLRPGDNIYFRPQGQIYHCNLAALVDDTGKHLCRKYHFFRVSDIRALPYDPENAGYCIIELFGGMNYEADPEQINMSVWSCHTKDMQKSYNDLQPESISVFDLGTGNDGTRAGISTLKESKNEVKFIFKLDESMTSPHTGADASEEAFRQFIRQSRNYMVHISTHSFNIRMEERPDETIDEWYDRYMLSCGLLFSGAAHTLRGEKMPLASVPTVPGGPSGTSGVRTLGYPLNDGLLYCAEIAKMDMSHCQMVVLAACNTAAGTVIQDGIIGLQTAFKAAGAHTLLMTLWSVDDRATSEFMKRFYTYLFSGSTKHESFERARADLMESEDFSDPLYWAPFIMLD